jgi:dGTP triphosphohydrolase
VPWKSSDAPVIRKWQQELLKVKDGLERMFDAFSRDVESGNEDSIVFTDFLHKMGDSYNNDRKNSPLLKVRDYITTMTDDYAAGIIASLTVPRPMFEVLPWKRK